MYPACTEGMEVETIVMSWYHALDSHKDEAIGDVHDLRLRRQLIHEQGVVREGGVENLIGLLRRIMQSQNNVSPHFLGRCWNFSNSKMLATNSTTQHDNSERTCTETK